MRGDLQVVRGGAAPVPLVAADPGRFQADCAEAYAASWVARGFSPVTVDSATSRLERVLATFGKPAWQVSREDVDRVVGAWAAAGIAASTRRTYVQAFKGFHEFLAARKAAEIEAVFGVRPESPLDEFNAARHVGCEQATAKAPPAPERLAVAGLRPRRTAGHHHNPDRGLRHLGRPADPLDQPGMRRFERPLSLAPRFSDLRFYTFPGGCITYRFAFAPGASPVLAGAADSALSFQPRSALVHYVRRTEGLALCGRGAPCPG